MQPLVGLEHEGVKVHPALRRDRAVVEGEVHQHRLAAPDPAPQIDAGYPLGLVAQQTGEQSAVPAGRRCFQPVERRYRAGLRRIGPKLARGDQRGIGRPDRPVMPAGWECERA